MKISGKRKIFLKTAAAAVMATALALFPFAGCARQAGINNAGTESTASAGVGAGDGASDAAGGINVVTTIFAPYDFVRQLSAGTDTNVSMLLSPGTEVHSYDPTVRDIIKISNCDLFVYTGGENDEWVNDILDSLDHPVRTFKMIDHVDSVVEEEVKEGMQTTGHAHSHDEADEKGHEGAHDEEHEHDHDNEDQHDHDDVHDDDEHDHEWDEHVWTSPLNAQEIVSDLADELCDLDGGNAGVYRNNLSSYSMQLKALDTDLHNVIENAPHKMMIFADRFPVRYFTEEFGLDYYAAYPGCAADAEPSAATMRFLIDRVRAENIKAVFYIEMSDERIADTVCEETGATKLLFHSCHNVTKDEMESGATYISIMRNNLENLKVALY